MSTQVENQTGLDLLRAAHMASQAGYDAIAHVQGISSLHVRDVVSNGSQTSIAIVHCWSGGESEAQTWFVPLASVRAIEIKGHWRPEN